MRLSWNKDALNRRHLHISQEWKYVDLFFNWRPMQFCLGADIVIGLSGIDGFIDLWFNFQFQVRFFNYKKNISS
jgi:hypothetical protein